VQSEKIRRGVAVLASGNHLCSNPRVVKEADALASAGFEVHVLGGAYSPKLKERDARLVSGKAWNYCPAYDLTRSAAARLWFKTQRRLGILLWTKLRHANAPQIFYGTASMARRIEEINADLTIAHWEAALPGTVRRFARGHPVGVDMEDWFSEDLLPSARASRPIDLLASFEKRLLTEGVHSTCPSGAMADALVARYGCRRPLVIRNVFSSSERHALDGEWKDRTGMKGRRARNSPTTDRPADVPVSIHWYSQTIGPGRGLEELMEAAEGLQGDFEIHLRGGGGGYGGWLDELAVTSRLPRIHIHNLVHNNELLSRIAEHDIGFAGERTEPPSRDLTVTNKFYQYLQGGLAVVASATAGQKEGAREAPGAVMLYQPGDVEGLRQVLQRLIDDRAKLHAMRAAAWEAGGRLCWENEAPKLVESVERALGARLQAIGG
jgi:glycosyltransferase involved in cell wall biosynthesis